MDRDILALGEILIDFTPIKNGNSKPRFEQNAGGAPVNVLAAAAKLGLKTGLIGCVGDDAFGAFLMDFLRSCGIDNEDVKISDTNNTTLAFVHIKRDGDRAFSFYRNHGADLMITEDDIREDLFDDLKVFHFGSLSLTGEPARSATVKAIRLARQKGCLISYDPNLRPPLWKSLGEARERILSVMEYVDILKLSEEELIFLTGSSDVEEGSKQLRDQYKTKLIITTLGAEGCSIRRGDEFGTVRGVKVEAVDTTGAGDSHLGAMLYQIIKAGNFIGLPFERLLEFGSFANHAAAYVTTQFGSAEIMPDFDRIFSPPFKDSR